jgi:hypothetical protein
VTIDDTTEARSMLALAFSERPMPVAAPAIREERRRRAISGIEAILAEPRPGREGFWHQIRPKQMALVMGLAAGAALLVSQLPRNFGRSPMATYFATESKGQVLCNRSDWANWTACDPSQTEGFVGLRTLDNAGVTVETAAGLRLHLDAASTLLMKGSSTTALASQVTLTEGSVDVIVPKLGPNRQFSIVTPSATITVHGTAFSVEVTKVQNQKTHTCVRLRDGAISVQADGHEERLVAPAAYGCDAPARTVEAAAASTTEVSAVPTPQATKDTGVRSNRDTAHRANPVNPDRSTLAAETKLLQRALQAERHDDLLGAEKNLRQLLTAYPNSIIAPEAREALERISGKLRNGRRE